jgi:lysozyme
MTTIQFTDAAKFFKGEPQQIDAFNYLQAHTSPEVVAEFERRFRTKPPTPSPAQSTLPPSGVTLIKEFEGCYLKAYPDPLTGGLPITIGWGSTLKLDGTPFHLGDKITQQEADDLLNRQLKDDYLPSLTKIPDWDKMDEPMQGCLLSFAYNLGANFYGGSGFNTISRCLKEKRWNDVPAALMLYVNPGSNVTEGLKRRRKAEGDLWSQGLTNLPTKI